MAKNTLVDLNDHLFAQLERLSDETITPEQLEIELARSKAIKDIAKNIVDNAKIALEGMKYTADTLMNNQTMPDQFKLKS